MSDDLNNTSDPPTLRAEALASAAQSGPTEPVSDEADEAAEFVAFLAAMSETRDPDTVVEHMPATLYAALLKKGETS